MRSRSSRRRRSGFTLIEVLLVMVILVILGSLAVGMFSNTQRGANMKAARSQIGLWKTPIETYNLELNSYPPDLEALRSPPANLTNPQKWNGPYTESIPNDPWGNPYQYMVPGRNRPDSYDLWSLGEDGQDGTEDDIGNWQTE